METWALIWKVMFIGVMVGFAGMSVWVTIGGWRDIKSLLRKLKDDADDDPPAYNPPD